MSRIISFSSDDSFSDGLEDTIKKSGYKNRSRFMRDAVLHFADYKQRGELSNMKGDEMIEGHLIVYYQHGIEGKLLEIRHSSDIDVANYNHSCLKQSHTCVDLIQAFGTAESFRKVLEKLQDTVSVDKVEFVSAPMREEGIEEIEELLGGHDEHDDEQEEESHGDEHEEGLKTEIMHVIEEVESGEINASVGIEEIHELVTSHSHSEHEEHGNILLIGGAILGGFILMLILEGSGIGHAVHEEHHDHSDEHGHGHVHHSASGWMLVFGLTLHAATDGIAIGAAAASGSFTLTATVVLAVLIHKGPAAFSLGVFSMHERSDRKESVRDVAIFSLATPLMMLIAYFALEDLETSIIGLAMLFSAGTFLYVATVDTLPDIHNPESGKKAMTHVVIGVVIMIALLAILNMVGIGHSH